MRFYEFGRWEAPVLMLLPGTCCHWRMNFESVIPLLREDFHVVCVSYDGFDEQEDTVFPDMITETERIEAYVQKSFGGHICAAYGCSLGGSFVSLLIQRGNIHIDHGFLGSSDMDQAGPLLAWIQAQIISRVMAGILRRGRLPGWMQKRLESKPKEEREATQRLMEAFLGQGGPNNRITRESIRNQFYSDLVTRIDDGIDIPGTTVHCFYAAKMGEKYLERYRRHFKNPDIVRHDLQHEELLTRYPRQWAGEVRRCCGLEEKGAERA